MTAGGSTMQFGLYLRDTCSDPSRPLYDQIEETVDLVRCARDLGLHHLGAPHHWLSYPSVWPQPVPLLARLAPESGSMRLATNIVQLPLCNPVDLAEQIATLDHISGGRAIAGVGLGYREAELEAAGATRSERAPRVEEAVRLMKLLWSGEEVSFQGRFWHVNGARMGAPPVQRPHPPLWMAGQSPGAVRRAGRLGDACLLGPQVGWDDLRRLGSIYRETAAERGSPGMLVTRRSMSVAADRETAIQRARAKAQAHFDTYRRWDMQERTMVELSLSMERELADWAIVGSPEECVETINRFGRELGIDVMTIGLLDMPAAQAARREHLQYVWEEVLARVG